MDLYLLRHAKSARSQTGIWGRTYDAALSPMHFEQLNDTRLALAPLHHPDVFSSPLLRCVQSLEYALNGKWPVAIIPEFRAYHSGLFENLTEAEIAEHHPGYLKLSYSERFASPSFGEESISEQAKRVRNGLRKLLCLARKSPVVICSHFSVINIIGNIVQNNFDLTTYAEGRFPIPEGGLLTLQANDNQLREALRDQ